MSIARTVLITGGSGYIGSHTATLLLQSGYNVVILDNLSNSSLSALTGIQKISGHKPHFIHGDIRDRLLLEHVFTNHRIWAVLHLAGVKSVTESVSAPLKYFNNNVAGTVAICEEMMRAGVYKLVFSSSAMVYGGSSSEPFSEDSANTLPRNPYGQSKLMAETVLKALPASSNNWGGINNQVQHPTGKVRRWESTTNNSALKNGPQS